MYYSSMRSHFPYESAVWGDEWEILDTQWWQPFIVFWDYSPPIGEPAC